MKISLSKYKAFLFDLNGTMIDDMDYHVKAWYSIIHSYGKKFSLEEVKEQCYGKNNELLERVFNGRFSEEEKNRISIEKEKQYQKGYRPKLALIKGLKDFLDKAYAKKIKMAIGSAAIPFNIDFVLDGLELRKYFDAVVSASDVKKSKPDPETYLACAARLNVESKDCLVFEDAPKGVESALNAGMECIAITTFEDEEHFKKYKNVIGFIKEYSGLEV